jgi:hypothetical protein
VVFAHIGGILLNVRALLALGLLSIATTIAVGSAAGSSVLVIRVKSVQTSARLVHNQPPNGLSKGDVLVVHDRLFNLVRQFGKPAGALIGSDEGTITLGSGGKATVVGTTTLPGGTVRVKGTVFLTGTGPTSIRVVGGTGRYLRASGSETEPGTDRSPGSATNTYRLTLP